MISSSIVAQQRGCLRYQLREALRTTWARTHNHVTNHGFATFHARHQEASNEITEDKSTLISPHGEGHEDNADASMREGAAPVRRVINKRGKHQVVASERITRNSLDKPTHVLVIRDIERPQRSRNHRKFVRSDQQNGRSSQRIDLEAHKVKADICGSSAKPSQNEVNKSIDELRPVSSIVDKAEYDRLTSTLLQSYNMVQLRGYKKANITITPPNSDAVLGKELRREINKVKIGSWRSGRTPLSDQPAQEAVKESTGSAKKQRLVEDILRFAWNLTVHSESQELGELELAVADVHLRLLFDLKVDKKAPYERIIGSNALLRDSEIRYYEPRSIIRITARRQDALEIASRLENALRQMKHHELDLKCFRPLLNKDGWPPSLVKVVRNQDIEQASANTGALVQREEDHVLGVYAFSENAAAEAKSILLRQLPEYTTRSHDEMLEPILLQNLTNSVKVEEPFQFLSPIATADSQLHNRYRNRPLVRIVRAKTEAEKPDLSQNSTDIPTESSSEKQSAHTRAARHIQSVLERIKPKYRLGSPINCHETSYWGPSLSLTPQFWRANFCELLQIVKAGNHVSRKPGPGDEKPTLIPHAEAPGTATFLSFLDKTEKNLQRKFTGRTLANHELPSLRAHFVPSLLDPNSNKVVRRLPAIDLRFRVVPNAHPATPNGNLNLTGVRGVLDQQRVGVPLPDLAADLLFDRPTWLFADIEAFQKDPNVLSFIHKLQKSYDEGDKLYVPNDIVIMLPAWLVHGQDPYGSVAAEPDVPVTYLFDRYEQSQTVHFKPTRDPGLLGKLSVEDRAVLEGVPPEMVVEYRQVEGGQAHGNMSQLTLRVGSVALPQGPQVRTAGRSRQQAEWDYEPSAAELAFHALGIADMLTRAAAGKIASPGKFKSGLLEDGLDDHELEDEFQELEEKTQEDEESAPTLEGEDSILEAQLTEPDEKEPIQKAHLTEPGAEEQLGEQQEEHLTEQSVHDRTSAEADQHSAASPEVAPVEDDSSPSKV